MSGKDKLISVDHLKWNVGGIKCGTLTVDYLNWILDHEEPAVDAEPVRHGKWIYFKKYDDDHNFYQCTLCKSVVLDFAKPWYLYCPNCGARMDAE